MSSLITYLLQVCLTLLVFGAIAAGLVRFGRRPAERRSGPLELLARLRLEGRRSIYLVRAGRRVLVVGSSEAGLTRLGELDRRDREALVTQRHSAAPGDGTPARGTSPSNADEALNP